MRPILHQVRVPSLPRRVRPWPTGINAPVPPPPTTSPFTIVRTGVAYTTLQNAINAAIAGDTILGVPGTYVPEKVDGYDWTTRVSKNLTIKSSVTGSKVVLNAASVSGPGGGAVLKVNDGISLTLEDFEITGNKHQDNYNPGVYTGINTGTVILRRCKVHECSNGIFNSNVDFTCAMTLEDCEIVNNGTSAGYYHNFYVGAIASLTLRGCWVHNTKTRDDYLTEYGSGNEWRESGGHLVKSRARVTTIDGCRLTMEVMSGSPAWWGANRCIDAANAGDLTVRGCLLEYRTGQNGGQGQAITWGGEGSVNLPGQAFDGRAFNVRLQQNTIVARSTVQSSVTNKDAFWICVGNYGWDGSQGGTQATPAPATYSVIDNIFCGWVDTPPRVLQGGYLGPNGTGYSVTTSTTYAISAATNTTGALSLLTDATTYNYTPVTPVAGSAASAPYYYVHPTSSAARTDSYRGAVPYQVVTWPQSVAVSTFASVPIASGKYISDVSPALTFIADQRIGMSYSQNLVWNDDYGPGGGGIFTGGGHVTSDYPFAWVFDGSLPGWVPLNVAGPSDGLATNTTYATGAEASRTQSNMPGGSVFYGDGGDPYWCKPQPLDPAYPTPYGYPAMPDFEYGEWSTGLPFGFHSWNSIFPIPANTMSMGSKGGWGTVCHHSMTRLSGKGVAWGHRIDGSTGSWSRWPKRMIAIPGNNDMGALMRSAVDGGFAYTKFNYATQSGTRTIKTSLTDGSHTLLTHTNDAFSANNLTIIPGTTIAVWLGPTQWGSGGSIYSVANGKATLWACVLSNSTPQVAVPMTSNTMPTASYWESSQHTYDSCFGQAGLAWVPEVGKFAAFHCSPPGSTNGTWPGSTVDAGPLTMYWITPPANVQSNYATQNWTVEEEVLSIPVGDTKARSATNRAMSPPNGPGTDIGFQYNSFAWSSKLRCFLWFPRPGGGYCFFIRTNKVP